MQQTIDAFHQHQQQLRAYDHAMGILSYDRETIMPRGATENLCNTMGVLAEKQYSLTVDPRYKELVEELDSNKDKLDPVTRAEVRLVRREMQRMERIPKDEYVAYEVARNEAGAAWRTAKETNDYQLFEPHLRKVLGFCRRFPAYIAPEKKPYDALIDFFEEGMTMEAIDPFFERARRELVPLIREIAERGRRIDDSFLKLAYPIADQEKLSVYLMDLLTMDPKRRVIGTTEHPFTTAFTKYDVRITTHYHEDMMASSMYSVIHEGGHALYELNVGDDIAYSSVGNGTSMGIHESQSRFYENIIGRSRAFVGAVMPKLRELFPAQLGDVDAQAFYLAVNKSCPSLIRTEADELTYPLHIMIRYELEKLLIDGALDTGELPAAWNRMYKEYLGIDVPSDREGVLQDSHWSFGGFGYFPSYALGSAYGAQMLASMERDLDVWSCVKEGDLAPIVGWMRERIYQYGSMKTPAEFLESCCHAPFDPAYYIAYLTKKFTEVYAL